MILIALLALAIALIVTLIVCILRLRNEKERYEPVPSEEPEKDEKPVKSTIYIHYGTVLTSDGAKNIPEFNISKDSVTYADDTYNESDMDTTKVSELLNKKEWESFDLDMEKLQDDVAKEEALDDNEKGESLTDLEKTESLDNLDDLDGTAFDSPACDSSRLEKKRDSLYDIKRSGIMGKKSFYQLYYPVGDDLTLLEQSIYTSRWNGYLAGQILAI